MEMIKKKNTELKDMLIGFGVIFLYLILSLLPYEFLSLFGINYNNLNIIVKQIYLIFYEITLTLIIVYIYRKNFIPNFKEFIKNIFEYIKKYIKYWIMMVGLMTLSNMIITMFTTTMTSQNQQAIIDTLKTAPIYTIILTIFVAPILEELVFRLSFRKIFAHTDFLFIFFSGLFFGGMHVLGTLTNLVDILFIIP
jgi:membrane protease YdiL (CAAX protease family)